MTIDLDLVPLRDAPRVFRLPGRRPGGTVSLATLWRWHLRGLRGGKVRLRAVRIGGTTCTTREWVEDFLAELNAGPQAEPPRPRTPNQRAHAAQTAKEQLESAWRS